MSKPLPPTLREKNRYIAYEVFCKRKLSAEEITRVLWKGMLNALGEIGTALTSFHPVFFNEKKQRGVVRVNHRSVEKVRAAFSLIAEVDGNEVHIHILRVSGTLKSLRERELM